ncbi:MAG: cyclic nucleotide-binding domain-containing protein [Polyangiaceae bacterium]
MSNQRQPRMSPPELPPSAGDASIDHALALLLADDTEAALRWGAAALEEEPSTPSALIVTSLLLWQMGRSRAAIEGLESAVDLAIAAGNLPLAIAAVGDLRTLGVNVTEHLDRVSAAFCLGSDRLQSARTPRPLPDAHGLRPLSPFLAGPALASRAAQILKTAQRTVGESFGPELPLVAPLPLFSELPREALRELLAAFEMITVSAGHQVVREGEVASAAYIVARGELEVSRRISEGRDTPPIVLTRLGAGSFFGEMALLSRLPSAASVVATRPSILLVARREAIEAIAARHPETGVELAAHCRRQSVSNLGWASPVLSAVPVHERAALVEMCETRVFGKGERLIQEGEEALGLHLVLSGEVAVIGRDGGERVVLATLTAGETVGDVELVLCRRSIADAVATRSTATLFLPRDEFFTLVEDHPGVLHALYAVAVRRHMETRQALEAGSSAAAENCTDDDAMVVDETLLRSHLPPVMTAPPAERPIVPARIVSVAGAATATRTARMAAVATTTLRMPTPTPPGPPLVSGRPESVGSTRAVSVQAHSSLPPTSATNPPAPRRLRRTGFQAVAGGAIAVAGGILIALVATHGRFGDAPSAAAGAAGGSSVPPTPEAVIATAAADPGPAPNAAATALSTAPRVSRSMAPPTIATYRVAPAPSMRATPAPRETPVPVAAPAASLPPAAVAAPPSESPKPVAPKAPATADEFGGRE